MSIPIQSSTGAARLEFFSNLFYLKFSHFVVLPSGETYNHHLPDTRGIKISFHPRDSFSKMDRFLALLSKKLSSSVFRGINYRGKRIRTKTRFDKTFPRSIFIDARVAMRSLFVGATLWQGYDKRAVKMELSIKLLARRFRSLALISLQFNDDTFLYGKFSREIFLKFYRITCTQPILILLIIAIWFWKALSAGERWKGKEKRIVKFFYLTLFYSPRTIFATIFQDLLVPAEK